MMKKSFLNIIVSFLIIYFHIPTLSNKYYLLLLVVFFGISWLVNKSILVALWHIFITIFPFLKGRDFLVWTVPGSYWGGPKDILMNYTFVFNQFFIVCLAYFLFRNKKSYVQSLSLSRKIASLLFILLTLCAGYATLFATFSEYAIYEYLIFVIIVSNFFISFLLIRTSKEINLTFQILFLHAFIICLLLIAQFTKGSQLGLGIEEKNALNPSGSVQFEAGNTFRPGGYFFDPNVAATWIIMIFPIFFTYALESKNYSFLTLPVSLLTSFAVVITKSRTAWIIFPFILSGLLYLAYRSKKFSTLTWRIFVSVFLFFLISASALFFQRIENFSITFSSTGGFYSRIDQYKVGLEYLFA